MSRGHILAAVLTALALTAGIPFSPVRDAVVRAAPADPDTAAFRWSGTLATGYDAYVQSYFLATEDTTERIQEMEVTLGAEGATAGPAAGRWRVAPQIAVGSERTRQRLDLGWSRHADDGTRLADVLAELRAVQYHGTTDYALSSDRTEGRVRLRWFPAAQAGTAGDVRLEGSALRHTDPSELEVDRNDLLLAAGLRSGALSDDRWRAGLRAGRRAHPDTTAIDRTTLGVDAEWERFRLDGVAWRTSLRSERRNVRDETARPSSWSHWVRAEAERPLSDLLSAELRLALEWWDYDVSRDAYTDQRRWSGLIGLRAPALDGPGWSLGVAWETLDGDDPDEPYRQLGLRGGLETYGRILSLSATVEVGRRDYASDDGAEIDPLDVDDWTLIPLFTDFTYTEFWLNGTWRVHERLSLTALASWLPESHSDDEDDQSLGFASLHAVLRF